jgi:hypothetical protein
MNMRQCDRLVYDDQRTKLGASVMISQHGLRRSVNYKRPGLQPKRQLLRTDDEAMRQNDDQLTSQTRRILQQTDDQPMLMTRRPILRTDVHKTAMAVFDIDDLKNPRQSKILNDGFASVDSGH